jgi:hypothetical protein
VTQTKDEKRELHATWTQHPTVAALDAAVAEAVAANGWTGSAGLTQTLQFTARWIDANGPLPESGILCD